MVQIRVGDTYLDLYQFDPPKLNLSIEDITDAAARSYFTKTFRLPATANNSTFFNTAFEINGQDFDVTVKIPAQLMIDGNLFTDGELRLNKVYISRENEKIEYECAFFGSVRSLGTSIGEGTLNLLDLTDYNHILTTDTIVQSWQAYPEGGDTDGLLNGNVIYPLVDFGNTYNGDGDVVEGEISNSEGASRLPFTDQNNALEKERFKPWIRAKAVWDQIFEEAGFTYTSSFLTGDTFRNLYISAHGNEASIFTQSLSNTARVSGVGDSDGEEIELTVNQGGEYDIGDNMLNGRYVAPQTGTYQFAYQLIGDGQSTIAVNITLRLRNDLTTLAFVNQTIDAPAPGQDDEFQFNLSSSFTTTLTAGDEINLQFTSNVDLEYEGRLTVVDAPGEISISPLLPEDYKQIDFVKDILNKYRLVLAPDKNNPTNFIIEPWVNYIASGDEFDWTDKLDVSKDVEIEPVFYTQKSKIEFTDSEGGDVYNQLYFDQFEEVYGTLRVFNSNDLIKGDRTIDTQSIPLLVTQIRGSEEANNGMDNTIIPQLNIHEAEDTGTQYLPVDSKNRYGYYNGIKSTGTVVAREDTWYVEDGGGTTGFTDYPMISSYSSFPLNASTIDFSWQREQGYIKYGLHDEFIGSSVYDVYWSSYLESLYNKWARKVTAYFVLNSQDLVDFSFDDVIFVKDAYYYVEKISDVPLGEKASVKVSLIKLLNR